MVVQEGREQSWRSPIGRVCACFWRPPWPATKARLLPSSWSTPHPQCKMQPVLAWKLATSLSSPLAKGQICSTLLENSLPAKQFRDHATGVTSGKQNGKKRKRRKKKKGEGEKEKKLGVWERVVWDGVCPGV